MPYQRTAELRRDEIEHLATRAARSILALTHVASPHAQPCLQKDLPLHDRGPQQPAGYRLTITRTRGPASDQPGPPGAEMIIAQIRAATLGGRGLTGRKRAAQHGLCNGFRACHQHDPLVRTEMDAARLPRYATDFHAGHVDLDALSVGACGGVRSIRASAGPNPVRS